jgi:tRNA 2-thiouridine synthesizing protein C
MGRASLDAALALAAFDQQVEVLFLGDGVLQLLPGQESEAVGVKNIGKLLASLPLYEITSVYVDTEAAERYGLDLSLAPLPCEALDANGVRRLMAAADHLLGF